MNRLRQRMPRLKLPAQEYAGLRTQALERDGWRCQFCGSSDNLQVHHQRPRGKNGDVYQRESLELAPFFRGNRG